MTPTRPLSRSWRTSDLSTSLTCCVLNRSSVVPLPATVPKCSKYPPPLLTSTPSRTGTWVCSPAGWVAGAGSAARAEGGRNELKAATADRAAATSALCMDRSPSDSRTCERKPPSRWVRRGRRGKVPAAPPGKTGVEGRDSPRRLQHVADYAGVGPQGQVAPQVI